MVEPAGAIKTDAFRVKRFPRNELGRSRVIYPSVEYRDFQNGVTIRGKLARYDTLCFIDRDLIMLREGDSTYRENKGKCLISFFFLVFPKRGCNPKKMIAL